MTSARPDHGSDQVNSDPIDFIRRMAQQHRPKLAVPENGTRSEYLLWSDRVKAKLREVLGLDYMVPTPPRISDVEHREVDGLMREWFSLETEPGYWAPVIVNVPNGKGPFPVVLCLHGHVFGGKEAISGLTANVPDVSTDDLRKQMARYTDTYALDLARDGYLTLSLDNRSFNQARHPQVHNSNDYDWHLAEIAWHNAFGRSIIGSMVWDCLQVLDRVLRRDDVDAERVGCIGFSLGGMLSLYVSLLEPRIKATVISGYFDSFLRRIVTRYADCPCNYIPGLYAWFDVPDLTAALMPRPVLCNNEVFPDPRAGGQTTEESRQSNRRILEKVKTAYRAVGAPENCELFMWEARHHTFTGERAYPWLEEHLNRPEARC